MRIRWFLAIGLAVFLAAPFSLALEPEQEGSGDELKKQEQVKAQDKVGKQERIRDQKKAQEMKQERNRHRQRKATGEGQAKTGEPGDAAQGSSGGSAPVADPADDTQLVGQEKDGEGSGDKVSNQNRGDRGKGDKGALKRGQHRYRNRNLEGTANQQGRGTRTRAGKGFGEGFKDSDGNGVCDKYQKRKGR